MKIFPNNCFFEIMAMLKNRTSNFNFVEQLLWVVPIRPDHESLQIFGLGSVQFGY